MRRAMIVLVLGLIAGILPAQEWNETQYGKIRFESARFGGSGSYQVVYVIVQYQNTTSQTFESVTLHASVLDSNERVIGTNRRSWYSFSDGPIPPGFSGVQEIPVEYTGSERPSMVQTRVTATQ